MRTALVMPRLPTERSLPHALVPLRGANCIIEGEVCSGARWRAPRAVSGASALVRRTLVESIAIAAAAVQVRRPRVGVVGQQRVAGGIDRDRGMAYAVGGGAGDLDRRAQRPARLVQG